MADAEASINPPLTETPVMLKEVSAVEGASVTAETKPSTLGPRGRRQQLSDAALDDFLLRRVTRIAEGDNVFLKLPSDTIKAVTTTEGGLVQLGKFGAFPMSQLIGLHYDVTYEIVPGPNAGSDAEVERTDEESMNEAPGAGPDGNGKKKKAKGKGKGRDRGDVQEGRDGKHAGWKNVLRPLKQREVLEAVVDDISETNEFIVDSRDERDLLTHEEIRDLKAQGVTADEIIERQLEKHDAFALKTDFSKEKWMKRKESKYLQTIRPFAPTTPNIVNHYATRAPASILYLREDSLSQLLVHANVRPDGRYLVVDDTGGLVTGAVLDRMGCQGRVLVITDSDSPPAWAILQAMNFGEASACVKWLTWLQAEEGYARPPLPDEEEGMASNKRLNKLKRHDMLNAELNGVRDELHSGGWDAVILATELSPISVISRLTPFLGGSNSLAVYTPFQQVAAETLQYCRRDVNYLAANMTESWQRTYQVLPGRTHPMMMTSGTGGFLLHATRVIPSGYATNAHQRKRQRNNNGQRAQQTEGAAVDSGDEDE
ncbi:tRNA (adenine(58)-N(1))-methyltransferase non-catalytic subunit trm6 [Cryptotrichosporon argae]